jgi:capsular polysaccharide transport system permease protein
MPDPIRVNPLKHFLVKSSDQPEANEAEPIADGKVVAIKPPKARGRSLRYFSVSQLILLPILAAAVYFYGVARDRYVTRSDFVIRKAEDAANADGNSLGSLLGRSNQLSLEDARFLKTYLQSPQVLKDLSRTFDLDKAYAPDKKDPFAGIQPDLSAEKRLKFFKKQVSVGLDEISGAVVLRTVAFDPSSSHDLNRFMLSKSEEFVNRLNQDISVKQLNFAEEELRRARGKLEQAKNQLINYQNANAVVIDPKGEAGLATATISKLQERLVDRKVELATLKRQYKDPREPEVLAVADEAKELEQQIAQEKRLLVATDGRNLNRKAAEVVKLESEVNFATDTYKLALTSVEKARVESKRQQKFMALLSAPQMPEDPQNDWRTRGFVTVLASCLVIVGLTKFVLGMQASHRQ